MVIAPERVSQSRPLVPRPPRRRDRAAALFADFGWLGVAFAIAALVTILWLLIRTDRGRVDPGDGDSLIAAGFLSAAIPAWIAWLALGLRVEGATPGQRTRVLVVRLAGTRMLAGPLVRLLVHPLSVPVWLWFAALAWIATMSFISAILLVIAGTIVTMSVVSAVLVMRDPAARALHDYIGGTTVIRRSSARSGHLDEGDLS